MVAVQPTPQADASPPLVPSTTRRALVRSAVWTAPVVTLAAAAPAQAASGAPARMAFDRTAGDAGEVVVTNPGAQGVTATLTFSPDPDQDTEHSLQAYDGFAGFVAVSSAPFQLRGTIPAGGSTSGWCWWRTATGRTGVTYVTAEVDGETISPLEITISS